MQYIKAVVGYYNMQFIVNSFVKKHKNKGYLRKKVGMGCAYFKSLIVKEPPFYTIGDCWFVWLQKCKESAFEYRGIYKKYLGNCRY